MTPLRYRQIHLDFHTSPDIAGIGAKFDKKRWQDTLQEAAVDSITIFSKCHHGWSYHPTKVGRMHPHLNFDLLRAQYEACKEININCPIYISAGVDNVAGEEHPEWRHMDSNGRFSGWVASPLEPGFMMMDFHSPYMDYLEAQINEAVTLFPECDGIFLDIISQNQPAGKWSLEYMKAHGLDLESESDRKKCGEAGLLRYYEVTTAAVRSQNPEMPVFHNAGHISRGRNDILPFFSHLELESLPTGGWGYDHFPMSAKYACNLPLDFLGMTGKFHLTWGEFGGFKHPNALRYECAAMLAFGSKCSIGDQLHPSGAIDAASYGIIGHAYREVAAKEEWCRGAKQIFDVAVLSSEAEHGTHGSPADEGACRALLESHILFAVVDRSMDFNAYALLILPDDIRIDEALKNKIDAYLAQGGKLLLSGASGLWKDREEFAFDIGAAYSGPSEYSPDYILPSAELRPEEATSPQVMYDRSMRIRAGAGQSLGEVYEPYFNRNFRHFCSHGNTPNRQEPSGFDCGVRNGNIVYLAHPVFGHYRHSGAVLHREFITRTVRTLLEKESIVTNLPSTARVSLTRQEEQERTVLHLLYAPTVLRGGHVKRDNGVRDGTTVEVIEDLPLLHDVKVALRLNTPTQSARLVPQGTKVPLTLADGAVSFTVDSFSCHQMVEIT